MKYRIYTTSLKLPVLLAAALLVTAIIPAKKAEAHPAIAAAVLLPLAGNFALGLGEGIGRGLVDREFSRRSNYSLVAYQYGAADCSRPAQAYQAAPVYSAPLYSAPPAYATPAGQMFSVPGYGYTSNVVADPLSPSGYSAPVAPPVVTQTYVAPVYYPPPTAYVPSVGVGIGLGYRGYYRAPGIRYHWRNR